MYASFDSYYSCILGLQPRNKATLLGVNPVDFFLEEFT